MLTNETIERKRTPRNRSTTPNTDLVEMKCLLGLIIMRGLHSDVFLDKKDLWYSEISSRPFYRAGMSLKRFEFLLQCLTFISPEHLAQRFMQDRFARMRPLFNHLQENCLRRFTPSPYLCLDETLRPFYQVGGCDFKVYLKDKPGKFDTNFKYYEKITLKFACLTKKAKR